MSGTSVFHGTILLTAANLVIRGVSMLFQIYLSARIGAEGLGLMQLISSVAMLALTAGSSGIRIAAMYLTAEEYGKRRSGGIRSAIGCCMRAGLVMSILAGLLLIRLAPFLAGEWIADIRAVSSLRLIGLFLPFTCLTSVMTGYFTACGKIRQMVVIELIERVCSVFLTALLLRYWAGADLARACCAIFAGSSITCTLSLFVMYGIYCRDRRRFDAPPPSLQMGKRLLRLCVPLAANEYLRSGLSTLENLLIPYGLRKSGASASRSMAAYGTIHGMVFPVITFASVILFSLSDVLVPELARCRAAGNDRRIRHLTDKCLRFGLVFAAAVAGVLFCLAKPLGLLLYRSAEAGIYIRYFAPLVLILYLDAIVDGMHKGLGQQLSCMRYNTLTSSLDVLLIFLLLPKYGIAGYLFSFTVTHLINFLLSLHRLITVTGYPLSLRFSLRISALALLAALAVSLLDRSTIAVLPTLALGGVYLCLFALLLSLSRTFTAADLRWIVSLLRPQRHPIRLKNGSPPA